MADTQTAARAVLFDSGDTLICPTAGEWLPGEVFRQIAQDWELGLDSRRLIVAHRAAFDVLARHGDQCLTEEDEVEHFERYFRALLGGAGVDSLDPGLVREAARETVERLPVACFPDTVPTLERLRAQGLRLGIISNGWPSLDRRYRELGLRRYFDVFVVSAHLGVRKPAPTIFEHAMAQLGIPARQTLFVDDLAENVEAARAIGFRAVLLARGGLPAEPPAPWIGGLEQIDRFL